MALTASQIGLLVSNRLGLPAFERPRIQTLINAGLEKLAQRVVNDTTKRHLLLTDKASVTASITNSNQDYYADLATAQSTNGVMLDYLNYGTVYHTYGTKTFTDLNVNGTTDIATVTSHGYPTGLKVQLSNVAGVVTGLSTSTDYYIVRVTASTLAFATSRANAFAGTKIDIAPDGSGTVTITPWEHETVQFLNREVGDLAQSPPFNYVYGWLVGTKLFTSALAGTFSFTVPFVPTLSTLPVKLEQELLDIITELASASDTEDE